MKTTHIDELLIQEAKKNGFKFIIWVCDTFSDDYYPVFCKDKTSLEKTKPKYNDVNMQRIIEVFEIEEKQKEDIKVVDSKYYTPEIEEMCVGFEYEWKGYCNTLAVNNDDQWSKAIIKDGSQIDDIFRTYKDGSRVYELRVKYLEKFI